MSSRLMPGVSATLLMLHRPIAVVKLLLLPVEVICHGTYVAATPLTLTLAVVSTLATPTRLHVLLVTCGYPLTAAGALVTAIARGIKPVHKRMPRGIPRLARIDRARAHHAGERWIHQRWMLATDHGPLKQIVQLLEENRRHPGCRMNGSSGVGVCDVKFGEPYCTNWKILRSSPPDRRRGQRSYPESYGISFARGSATPM
jgi:hypothetical protein